MPIPQAWQQPAPRPAPSATPAPRLPSAQAPTLNAVAPAVPPPGNAALAMNQAPRPRIRMQGPDTPAVPEPGQPLALPSPEALGIRPTMPNAASMPAAELDWNELRGRLRQLGATGFHLDQVAGGNWRATLLVPDAAADGPRRVEAVAASEAAALAGVLAQVGSR